jgi:CRP-like cAMP-binding protein
MSNKESHHCLLANHKLPLHLEALKEFAAKEDIFIQGSYCGHVIYLKTGHAKIVRNGSDGKTLIVSIAGPGDFLSDPLGINHSHQTSAIALTYIRVGTIENNLFHEALLKSPNLGVHVIKNLSRQKADIIQNSYEKSYFSVRERLTSLLYSHHVSGASFHYTRGDIANTIGSSLETCSRLMSELKTREIIKESNQRIIVIDLIKLQKEFPSA